ncbi:uncharacterized protein LOC128213921 [Mya arenaria]|uniref:uncharacterized protein LOC128213921 n=1 Tax=Mya arenaria TaxID=6604 RepID=UPI0022E6F9A0|nr:uncharacterized protein LOC128213921 [Mya arenaria]
MAEANSSVDGKEYFSRVQFALTDCGNKLLSHLLQRRVRELTPKEYPAKPKSWSLDEFLNHNMADILLSVGKDRSKKEILYPFRQDTDLTKWDIPLFALVLLTACKLEHSGPLHRDLKQDILNLKDIRNKMQHKGAPILDEQIYLAYLSRIDGAVQRICDYMHAPDLKESLLKELDEYKSLRHTYPNGLVPELGCKSIDIINDADAPVVHGFQQLEMIIQEKGLSVDIPVLDVIVMIRNYNQEDEHAITERLLRSFSEALENADQSSSELDVAVKNLVREIFDEKKEITKVSRGCLVLSIQCHSIDAVISLVQDSLSGKLGNLFEPLEEVMRTYENHVLFEVYVGITRQSCWALLNEMLCQVSDACERRSYTLESKVQDSVIFVRIKRFLQSFTEKETLERSFFSKEKQEKLKLIKEKLTLELKQPEMEMDFLFPKHAKEIQDVAVPSKYGPDFSKFKEDKTLVAMNKLRLDEMNTLDHQMSQHMDRDPDRKQAMSMRLSKVLGDIGVNREMIIWRRKTWLTNEKLLTVYKCFLQNPKTLQCFIFGSQSEGTTTLGMESDTDEFCIFSETNTTQDWSEWQTAGIRSLLLLKNEHYASQPDISLLVTLNMQNVDREGRMLLHKTRVDTETQTSFGKTSIETGPSGRNSKYFDFMNAPRCIRRPDKCMFLFHRPRPGHWPTSAILAKARQTPMYIVPQGHTAGFYPELEWRFSTPHIERLLMFDLNMIHLKVYIFLKILRKTFFKTYFNDRFSSFHVKTAMFFTIENYPPNIWKNDNLIQCVIYCLTTLMRWCRIHYCPHYIISGVDLFEGKLKKFELTHISGMLSKMIENIYQYVEDIKIDQVGARMLMLTGTKLPIIIPRSENTLSILQFCLEKLLIHLCLFASFLDELREGNVSQLIVKCSKMLHVCDLFVKETDNAFTRDAFFMLIKSLKILLTSVKVSVFVQAHQAITEEISDQYQASMDFDISSGRLKFATMLFCTGQYCKAAEVLEHIERLLHPDVWQFSFNKVGKQFRPSQILFCNARNLPLSEFVKTSVAFSVKFCRHELHCVPTRLIFEINKTSQVNRKLGDGHMDSVTIESIPFLYYLQYLTYRQLGQHAKRWAAVNKLAGYLNDDRNWYGCLETAFNVLGHCWELEQKLDLAWMCYSRSLRIIPYNNAAHWHMAIIINNIITKKCTTSASY